MQKKLLIVDDEAGILQLLKDYFEIQGYEVVTAKTGKEAIESAGKKCPVPFCFSLQRSKSRIGSMVF